MLEAERAGARALVVFMHDFPRGSEDWKTLRKIHDDEAHNCALIGEQLKKAGVGYSHATGPFFEKATAIADKKQRIEFLVKGLKWAVREFEAELPKLNPEAQQLFVRMRDSHLRSIAACERVAVSL
jgi:hypothetical protein